MSDQTREEQNASVFAQSVAPSAPPPQQQFNQVSKQSGFQVPVESVTLPSGGKLYPLGHPLCNETHVQIKCMTAKEEDLLTSQALIRDGTVISKLVESCICNKTIDADSLLEGDRNAILIALRITGYGADYQAKITCPECDAKFENEFSLSGLTIKRGLPPSYPNVNLFDFVLPSGATVQFRLLDGATSAEISKGNDQRKKTLKTKVETVITSRLLHAIVSINGNADKQHIAYAVQNMSARDSRALRNYIDEVEPGIDMKQWAKCPECGEQSEVSVPLGLNFFWPDAGK